MLCAGCDHSVSAKWPSRPVGQSRTQLLCSRATADKTRERRLGQFLVIRAQLLRAATAFSALSDACTSQRPPRTCVIRNQSHSTLQQQHVACSRTAQVELAAEQQVVFRTATSASHLQQASALRAEAYYEVSSALHSFFRYSVSVANFFPCSPLGRPIADQSMCIRPECSLSFLQEQPHARYVDSFKRQFVDQSVRLLKQQTARSLNALLPECVCLVALLPENDQILATCDVRPPADAAGRHPVGVPSSDRHAAYVTNVAVDSNRRGQGLGFQLLEAAAAFAYEEWQAQAVYTTVDSANKVSIFAISAFCIADMMKYPLPLLSSAHYNYWHEVMVQIYLQAAANLYAKCGFQEESSKQRSEDGTGKTYKYPSVWNAGGLGLDILELLPGCVSTQSEGDLRRISMHCSWVLDGPVSFGSLLSHTIVAFLIALHCMHAAVGWPVNVGNTCAGRLTLLRAILPLKCNID